MRSVYAIFRKEFSLLLVTPFGYGILALHLLLSGYFFLNLLSAFRLQIAQAAGLPTQSMQSALNLNEGVFNPYLQTLGLLSLLITPLLASRAMTEERSQGTLELLLFAPISRFAIVLGKFFAMAGALSIIILCASSFAVFLALQGNAELPMLCAGILGLLLFSWTTLALAFVIASFCERSSTATLLSIVFLLFLYLIHIPAESLGAQMAWVLQYISPKVKLAEMVTGELRLSGFVYFISLMGFALLLARLALPDESSATQTPLPMEEDHAALQKQSGKVFPHRQSLAAGPAVEDR
jgi:ABC-2 type transport system permease protein